MQARVLLHVLVLIYAATPLWAFCLPIILESFCSPCLGPVPLHAPRSWRWPPIAILLWTTLWVSTLLACLVQMLGKKWSGFSSTKTKMECYDASKKCLLIYWAIDTCVQYTVHNWVNICIQYHAKVPPWLEDFGEKNAAHANLFPNPCLWTGFRNRFGMLWLANTHSFAKLWFRSSSTRAFGFSDQSGHCAVYM